MDENVYKRQKDLNINTNQSITVVGCGGIGFWVCKLAAMSGIDKIYAFDNDIIEEHNLNRLDLPLSFIGKNKAEVTKQVVIHLRPDCTFFSMPFKYKGQNTNTDWLVDCTDKVKVQEKNQEFAKQNGIKYFKAGYDGESFSIHNEVAEWGEIEDEGYTIVPSWVVPAVLVASLAVAKITKYNNAEFASTIPNLLKGRF
jgi:molybdopterin/thiamine biosynthesis adenylyltransferase